MPLLHKSSKSQQQQPSRSPASTKTVETTAEDFIKTLSFGPDCTVDAILPGGNAKLAKELTNGLRLVGINGHTPTNRGELKECILDIVSSGNHAVSATFEKAHVFGKKVAIEESVTFNGNVSTVAVPDSAAMRELKYMVSPPSAAIAAADDNQHIINDKAAMHQSSSLSPAASRSMLEFTPSASESSLSDFNPVRITPPPTPPMEVPPELPVFEKMKLSMRAEDIRAMAQHRATQEVSMKGRLALAVDKAAPGCCVLCVVQDINPIAEIELLALAQGKRVISIDLGVKLRLRPQPEAFAAQFSEAMRSGAWFVVVNAHKSINTCLLFDELLEDARRRNLEGFDPNARIIVSLEPHPHFPPGLLQGAVVIKLVSSFQGSAILSDSMATSMSRNRLVTAGELSASMRYPAASRLGGSMVAAQRPPAKKRVRISAAVDIVDIAPREVTRVNRHEAPIDVSGSVALLKSFTGVLNDKFLCVKEAGGPGRFAVGSSLGNVYFLDSLGNSLLQTHAHNASIWDVSFQDKYHFATGCEDGTSATWQLTASNADLSTEASELAPTTATSLGADVYCVSYLKNTQPSPLIIGGLHNNIVIRPADDKSDNIHLVPIPVNAQVIGCLPTRSVALVGGGDGSVSVIDVDQAKSIATITEHTRKLPALSVRDDNHFFTGSFDSHILSWDLRIPGGVNATIPTGAVTAQTVHTLKLKNYVTGIDVDDVHLAASVGENLYVWDVRKLNVVLAGYPQGWKGLSRGIKVQSMSSLIVTASPDGVVRFWNYVS